MGAIGVLKMPMHIQNTMQGLLHIDFFKRGNYVSLSMVMMLQRGTRLCHGSQGKDHKDEKQNLEKPNFKSIFH